MELACQEIKRITYLLTYNNIIGVIYKVMMCLEILEK